METVGIRELRQSASQVIRAAEAGRTITVTLQGRPAARIVPIDAKPFGAVGGLELMARAAKWPKMPAEARQAWLADMRSFPDDEDFRDPWESRQP